MVLVDTNVLAYLLIEGDRTRDARKLFALDDEWTSEVFLLAEFSNILATYERGGRLSRSRSEEMLAEAETRVRGLIRVTNLDALRAARRFRVSAYDGRFLAAAEAVETTLVTEDARLRAAAPALTCSLGQALAASV